MFIFVVEQSLSVGLRLDRSRDRERTVGSRIRGTLKTGTVLVICVKLRDPSEIIKRGGGDHYLCREGHKFVEQNLRRVIIFYL